MAAFSLHLVPLHRRDDRSNPGKQEQRAGSCLGSAGHQPSKTDHGNNDELLATIRELESGCNKKRSRRPQPSSTPPDLPPSRPAKGSSPVALRHPKVGKTLLGDPPSARVKSLIRKSGA